MGYMPLRFNGCQCGYVTIDMFHKRDNTQICFLRASLCVGTNLQGAARFLERGHIAKISAHLELCMRLLSKTAKGKFCSEDEYEHNACSCTLCCNVESGDAKCASTCT